MNDPRPHGLECHDIAVRVWGTTILESIGFRLHPGELCAMIGPSGAGKSTLIRVLLGVQEPSDGSVALWGRAPDEAGPVGYVPQHDALHPTLTVRQELRYAAMLRRPELGDDEIDALVGAVCGQVELGDRLGLRIKRLSGGQRKRVSVAMELLSEPSLLILDEPTSGLDPGLEAQLMGRFAEVAGRGRIVIVATHAMQSVEICQALLVLVGGRLAYFGPPVGALDYFRTDSYEGLFPQLAKLDPGAWYRNYLRSDVARSFAARPTPPLASTLVEHHAASPSGSPPRAEPLAQPLAESATDRARRELKRLKEERRQREDS